MGSEARMIVGLGNPGPQYAGNRHNIGFQVVDLFAQRHRVEMPRMQFKARIGDGWISHRPSFDAGNPFGSLPLRQKVLLVKPLTYMNNSGQSVASLANYYDIDPEAILVIHDDLDLEPGKIRLRPGGGSGGQNGIKSIIRLLGTHDFPRLRVGIGRPPGRMNPADYVLQNFSRDEEEIFAPLRPTAADAIECWLFEGLNAAMNRYNG
jgi:PTH1 family peptidyl-tRNA hydrolase